MRGDRCQGGHREAACGGCGTGCARRLVTRPAVVLRGPTQFHPRDIVHRPVDRRSLPRRQLHQLLREL